MDINRRSFIGGASLAAGLAATPGVSAAKAKGGRAVLGPVEAAMEQHRRDWGLPGMTLAVVDRDGFTGLVHSGYADLERKIEVGPDHLFQIGSITKMMTGLAAWSLIDEGKLAADARLADLLPGLGVTGGEAVTLQHLLNHVSGLPGNAPLFPAGGLWIGPEPGAHWAYSNTGYDIAGKIIAAADGRTFPEALEARVLGPLGMSASKSSIRIEDREAHAQGYRIEFHDRPTMRPGPMRRADWIDSDSAAGCVSATAGNMAKFLRFLLGLAQGDGGGVISDEGAVRFLETASPAPGWAENALYGNGIAHVDVDGRRYLHHTGGMVSFSSALHVDPEAGVAAFASSNVHYGLGYRPRDVTVFACEALRAAREGGAAPQMKPSALRVEKPERYAGVFTAADGDAIEIMAGADEITVMHDGRKAALQQAGASLFATDAPRFARTGLVFDMKDDVAHRLWAGDVEFLRDTAAGFTPAPPAEIARLAGRYENDDRWWEPVTIFARDGGLWANNTDRLARREDGSWRPADEENSAERIRFSGVLDGRPQVLSYSGVEFTRRFS